MLAIKPIFFIFIISILLTACNTGNINESSNESSVEAVQTASQTTPQTNPPAPKTEASTKQIASSEAYLFEDKAVKKAVEAYLNKTASELNKDNIKTLSELDYFVVEEPIETLKDIKTLFPSIKYLNINAIGSLSKEDCDILENISSLKALTIYSRPIQELDFARNLSYFEISYPEEDCLAAGNNLSSFSVLGEDFINKNISGNPLKFTRFVDKDHMYELVFTDKTEEGEFFLTQERKVFVSSKKDGTILCDSVLDGTSVVGDAIRNQIYLADVNFDGEKDILIDNGHFGNQGLVTFTCFLNNNGQYEKCAGFSEIANPSIDSKNKKVLSVWRNWAASHSWAMYTYYGTDYIMTDRLTEEAVTPSAEANEEIWKYTIEKLVNAQLQEAEAFTTEDYTSEQIREKVYSESSDWGLSSDKWNTLFNSGKMVDFSIYGNHYIDHTILDAISQ